MKTACRHRCILSVQLLYTNYYTELYYFCWAWFISLVYNKPFSSSQREITYNFTILNHSRVIHHSFCGSVYIITINLVGWDIFFVLMLLNSKLTSTKPLKLQWTQFFSVDHNFCHGISLTNLNPYKIIWR